MTLVTQSVEERAIRDRLAAAWCGLVSTETAPLEVRVGNARKVARLAAELAEALDRTLAQKVTPRK